MPMAKMQLRVRRVPWWRLAAPFGRDSKRKHPSSGGSYVALRPKSYAHSRRGTLRRCRSWQRARLSRTSAPRRHRLLWFLVLSRIWTMAIRFLIPCWIRPARRVEHLSALVSGKRSPSRLVSIGTRPGTRSGGLLRETCVGRRVGGPCPETSVRRRVGSSRPEIGVGRRVGGPCPETGVGGRVGSRRERQAGPGRLIGREQIGEPCRRMELGDAALTQGGRIPFGQLRPTSIAPLSNHESGRWRESTAVRAASAVPG